MKFEKNLFGVSLNYISIAKYVDGEKIIIKVERNGKQIENLQITFDNNSDYITWSDNIYDANGTGVYCHYGDAELVNRAINYIETGKYFKED